MQEVDIELDSAEQTVSSINRQLEGSEELCAARTRSASERQHLEELKKQQRATEQNADDIDTRLKKIEGELYSGHVRSQKELSGLQREADNLKAERGKLESRELELMEQAERAGKSLIFTEKEFQAVEEGWQRQKQRLAAELEQAKAVLAGIMQKRQQAAAGIEPSILNTYHDVKKARGKAVVPVERGICSGCRINLPVAQLQQVRSGRLVRCSSCGRILYAP